MKGVYALGTYVPKIAASSWVAPNAAVVGNVVMQEASSVWFGATVRGDNPEPITIGERLVLPHLTLYLEPFLQRLLISK